MSTDEDDFGTERDPHRPIYYGSYSSRNKPLGTAETISLVIMIAIILSACRLVWGWLQ